jgi:hypothetical protein
MVDLFERVAPFRAYDGVVHVTFQRDPRRYETKCGRVCVAYASPFSIDVEGIDVAEGVPITCVACLAVESIACPSCRGCGEALHACPYVADVHDDPTAGCHCCAGCAAECARDI